MKKNLYIATMVLGLGCASMLNAADTSEGGVELVDTQAVTSTLTQDQIDGLVFMYQEEKLARDVYRKLKNKWHLRVFENIVKAERRHMNKVKRLLDYYHIPIPVDSKEIGVFADEELQALYKDLLAKGRQSREDALEVGVLVEETDIADLKERMTDIPRKIRRVYRNLLQGSRSHLKAFNRQLERL